MSDLSKLDALVHKTHNKGVHKGGRTIRVGGGVGGGEGVILREAGGAKFSEGARFSRATKFFCKRVISVATLL